MKLLVILALVATSFLPVLPAAAQISCRCQTGSDHENHQSSLSSTSESSDDCND